MSIRHLDQFRYLFGEPLEITAHLATYPGQPWAGESVALYVLPCESGLLATGFDDGLPWNRDWPEDYRIEGLEAIARDDIGWPSGGFSTLEFTTRDRPDAWLKPAFTRRWFPDAFLATMGELFLAVEEDRVSRRSPDATPSTRFASSKPGIGPLLSATRCISKRSRTLVRQRAGQGHLSYTTGAIRGVRAREWGVDCTAGVQPDPSGVRMRFSAIAAVRGGPRKRACVTSRLSQWRSRSR